MNAQSNHPINDTTDPQFLGPEAGQQAAGKAREGQEGMHGTFRRTSWATCGRSCMSR